MIAWFKLVMQYVQIKLVMYYGWGSCITSSSYLTCLLQYSIKERFESVCLLDLVYILMRVKGRDLDELNQDLWAVTCESFWINWSFTAFLTCLIDSCSNGTVLDMSLCGCIKYRRLSSVWHSKTIICVLVANLGSVGVVRSDFEISEKLPGEIYAWTYVSGIYVWTYVSGTLPCSASPRKDLWPITFAN